MYYIFHDPEAKDRAYLITYLYKDKFYTQNHTSTWQPTITACLLNVTGSPWDREINNFLQLSRKLKFIVVYSGEALPSINTHPELFL